MCPWTVWISAKIQTAEQISVLVLSSAEDKSHVLQLQNKYNYLTENGSWDSVVNSKTGDQHDHNWIFQRQSLKAFDENNQNPKNEQRQ